MIDKMDIYMTSKMQSPNGDEPLRIHLAKMSEPDCILLEMWDKYGQYKGGAVLELDDLIKAIGCFK